MLILRERKHFFEAFIELLTVQYSSRHDLYADIQQMLFDPSSLFLSVGILFLFYTHYGDHSVPTWCNLITVDLGIPRLCPRGAVQNASREHPVLSDRNIRSDRWLINHGGARTVSMGGLPLESAP